MKKIPWETLKSAERDWKLDEWKREEIFENCINGKKVGRFSLRQLGVPLLYAGTVTACLLAVLFIWPFLTRSPAEKVVYVDGAAAEAKPDVYVEKQEPQKEPAVQVTPSEKENPSTETQDPAPETQDPGPETQDPASEKEDLSDEGDQSTENSWDENDASHTGLILRDDPMVKSVVRTGIDEADVGGYGKLVRLTKGDLGELFDYEIYYYGIKEFYIDVDGKTMELRDALAKDPKIIDKFYDHWYKDFKPMADEYEQGFMMFYYKEYTAFKMNRVSPYVSPKDLTVDYDHRNKDLIIARPNSSFDEVRDRIMIGNNGIDPLFKYDRMFVAKSSIDPLDRVLVLRKNEFRFEFRFSSISNFVPRGIYKEEGNKLILQTQGEFDFKYVFEKVADGYRFLASESSEIPSYQYGENTRPICPVPDGTIFKSSS